MAAASDAARRADKALVRLSAALRDGEGAYGAMCALKAASVRVCAGEAPGSGSSHGIRMLEEATVILSDFGKAAEASELARHCLSVLASRPGALDSDTCASDGGAEAASVQGDANVAGGALDVTTASPSAGERTVVRMVEALGRADARVSVSVCKDAIAHVLKRPMPPAAMLQRLYSLAFHMHVRAALAARPPVPADVAEALSLCVCAGVGEAAGDVMQLALASPDHPGSITSVEADLLASRIVLTFLAHGHVAGAGHAVTSIRTHTHTHTRAEAGPTLAERLEASPLWHFARFACLVVQYDAAPVWSRLTHVYTHAMARDPGLKELVAQIGATFFNIAPPRSGMAAMLNALLGGGKP